MVIVMTENKPFELTINERGQADIIDWMESKEKNAICIYNDLGVPPYSSAKAVCNKLNEQDEEIQRLKTMNNELIKTIQGISKDSAETIMKLWTGEKE